jgi:glycosyltransferase involved in cell wall biosynthesis
MHPSRNPRLVRSASCLAREGHVVFTVYPNIEPGCVEVDVELAAKGGWTLRPIDLMGDFRARLRWQKVRWRRRLARELTRVALAERFVARAINYITPEMVRAARATNADLFIAQQHATVPAAARAAEPLGKPFAIDVEDLLSDIDADLQRAMRYVEKRHFPQAAFFYSMSEAAIDRIRKLSGSSSPGFVLHNTPSLAERGDLVPPSGRAATEPPTIYWFGQTLGPHSCADTMLEAIAKLARPVHLALRGNPIPTYVESLRFHAARLGISDRLHILPTAHPNDMVSLCAGHAFCLGSQPTSQLFHQLAIGNKVFTGMMAGSALILTNTIAHRRLVGDANGCAILYDEENPAGLSDALGALEERPDLLLSLRERSWDLAGNRYNWETESLKLIAAVQRVLL